MDPGEPALRSKLTGYRRILFGGLIVWAPVQLAATPVQAADERKPAQLLNYEQLHRLVRSNQITFRRSGGKIEAVCRCGPKVYLHQVSRHLKRAVVAIEDRRFFVHKGVDPFGIARGIGRWLVSKFQRREGGSTLTQQMIKNTVLHRGRVLARKFDEANLALTLETKMSKGQILTTYLNQTVFGHYKGRPILGVEQAARHFYGRRARNLTLYQAAELAGLLKAPTTYNPLNHPEAARKRARLVLKKMVDYKMITPQQRAAALRKKPRKGKFKPLWPETRSFTGWVVSEVRRRFPKVKIEPGLRIPITLEVESQFKAERSLARSLRRRRLGKVDAGFVTMAKDGRVVLMIGGRNFSKNQFNTATAAKRQPASTFKPFVYLTAFQRGTAKPSLHLTKALARSDNTIPVKLAARTGTGHIIRTARKLGIQSKLNAKHNIALGASEVNLLELTRAYAAFASGGYRAAEPYGFRGLVHNGRVLYWRRSPGRHRVMKRKRAQSMQSMLRRVVTHGTGRPARHINGAAGKTGTTDGNRDSWFVGYTPRHVSGLWLGRLNNRPVRGLDGTVASAVWAAIEQSLPNE